MPETLNLELHALPVTAIADRRQFLCVPGLTKVGKENK